VVFLDPSVEGFERRTLSLGGALYRTLRTTNLIEN